MKACLREKRTQEPTQRRDNTVERKRAAQVGMSLKEREGVERDRGQGGGGVTSCVEHCLARPL
jgi:hypothetical protein